jgi:hypothetical protein
MNNENDPLGIANDLAKAQLEPEDSYVSPDGDEIETTVETEETVNPAINALESLIKYDEVVQRLNSKKEAFEVIETLMSESKVGRASLEGVFNMLPNGNIEKAKMTEGPSTANREALDRIAKQFIKEIEEDSFVVREKSKELIDLINNNFPHIYETKAVIDDLINKFEELKREVEDSKLFVKLLDTDKEDEAYEVKYFNEIGVSDFIVDNEVLQDAVTYLYNRYNSLVDILNKNNGDETEYTGNFIGLLSSWIGILSRHKAVLNYLDTIKENDVDVKLINFEKTVNSIKLLLVLVDYIEENRNGIIDAINNIEANI